MSPSANVRVYPVPLQMVPDVWGQALPLIERGNQVAKSDPVTLLLDLVTGHAVLWLVFVSDSLAAVYFSSVCLEDDGRKSLMVHGLGGGRLRAWLASMVETMEAHAKAQGCWASGFYGVKGWGRLVPQYDETPHGDGVSLYRRALT